MQERNTALFPCPRDPSRDAGFSLLELLVALLVLSMTSLGLSAVAMMNTSGNTRSGDHAAAVALGAEKVEELRNQGFENLVAGSAADGPLTPAGEDDGGGPFFRQWTITDGSLNGLPSRDIRVEVSWTGGGPVVLVTRLVDISANVSGMPATYLEGWNQVR